MTPQTSEPSGSPFTGYDPETHGGPAPGAQHTAAPVLESEPVLAYGSARKLNKKGLAFLASIGALGLGLLAWGYSQVSLFGKSTPAAAPVQQVVIPEDPVMPPVPTAAAPAAPELPPLPAPPPQAAPIPLSNNAPPPAPIPVSNGMPPAPVVHAAPAPLNDLMQQRQQGGGLVMEGEKNTDEGVFKVAKGKAQRLSNPDYLLTRGTYVRCTLETRLVSSIPGFATCIVNEPVYSTTGRHIVIPKGSRVSGEYRPGSSETGRAAVIWDRVLTPDHLDISLSSPGIDGLGGAGHPGHVDRHWGVRIGSALLISLMSDVIQVQANRLVPDDARTTTTLSGVNGTVVQQVNPYQTQTAATLQRAAQDSLQQLANTPTTVTINQGQLINIYTSRDIDFSTVLE